MGQIKKRNWSVAICAMLAGAVLLWIGFEVAFTVFGDANNFFRVIAFPLYTGAIFLLTIHFVWEALDPIEAYDVD